MGSEEATKGGGGESYLTSKNALLQCRGSTLLHVAAACGSETIISALLQAGAKASARSERGFLALHLATTAEAIAALIEHCPEVGARRKDIDHM